MQLETRGGNWRIEAITREPADFPLARRIAAGMVFIFPAVVLAAVLLQPFAEPKWMFLDTLAAAEYAPDCCHVYYGLVSNLGLLLWSGTAAVCLLAGLVFLSVDRRDPFTLFALSAGLLTGWIAIDDMFLVHEKVLPALGVPQTGSLPPMLGWPVFMLLRAAATSSASNGGSWRWGRRRWRPPSSSTRCSIALRPIWSILRTARNSTASSAGAPFIS